MDTDTDKRLRTLSLFSGIGGIELGLRRWCRTVCCVELDDNAPVDMNQLTFSVKEAAKILGVQEKSIRWLIISGKLPKRKIGKYIRFTMEDIHQCIERCKVG